MMNNACKGGCTSESVMLKDLVLPFPPFFTAFLPHKLKCWWFLQEFFLFFLCFMFPLLLHPHLPSEYLNFLTKFFSDFFFSFRSLFIVFLIFFPFFFVRRWKCRQRIRCFFSLEMHVRCTVYGSSIFSSKSFSSGWFDFYRMPPITEL